MTAVNCLLYTKEMSYKGQTDESLISGREAALLHFIIMLSHIYENMSEYIITQQEKYSKYLRKRVTSDGSTLSIMKHLPIKKLISFIGIEIISWLFTFEIKFNHLLAVLCMKIFYFRYYILI